MRAIQILIDHMDDTLEEAHEYYRDYIIFKDDAPYMAKTSLDLANAHLDHYLALHRAVSEAIANYKSKNNDIPDEMQTLWEYEHKKLEEEFSELKYLLSSYSR